MVPGWSWRCGRERLMLGCRVANSGSVEQVAGELAAKHRLNDPQTVDIYRIPARDEVRLLEVTGSVGHTGDLLPFRFAARPELGVPYPSVVVLASPSEWCQLQAGELKLPLEFGRLEDLKKVG